MWLHFLPNAKVTEGFNSLMHKKDTGHCCLLWNDLVKVPKKKFKIKIKIKKLECSAFTDLCLLCEGSS